MRTLKAQWAEDPGPEETDYEGGTHTVTEEKTKVQKPALYRVVLLNDDYTPMEFVVWLLITVFQKTNEEATRLMLDVHYKGKGICGLYPYDVARTKVEQVKELAKSHQHPLECILEKE